MSSNPDTHDPLRIAALIGGRMQQHPYIQLLHHALEERGVRIHLMGDVSPWKAMQLPPGITAVHLHWPDFLPYHSNRRFVGPLVTHALGLKILGGLRALRRARPRFVWTVHDLMPHDGLYPQLNRAIFQQAALADGGVLLHSHYAATRLQHEFKVAGPVAVAPIGNFIGYYRTFQASRDVIRTRLGVTDDCFLYLMFGNVRPYKCTADAILAFRQMTNQDVRLVVIGKPGSDAIADEVRSAAGDDPRITLDFRFVPEGEVGPYHEAADAAVLNHREVFSSGVLMVALSHGLPVVAPDYGTTRELVRQPAAELFKPGYLTQALQRVREGSPAERARAARATAAACSWENMADVLIDLYRGHLPTREVWR